MNAEADLWVVALGRRLWWKYCVWRSKCAARDAIFWMGRDYAAAAQCLRVAGRWRVRAGKEPK